MPAIMADHDIEGHVQVLLRLIGSTEWSELWQEMAVQIESFTSLGLPYNTPDAELWHLCQTRQIVLITGNRNKIGPEALEATIERSNTPDSLPVLTIGDPARTLTSRAYADRVVTRLLEYLLDLEQYRGTGRLYLP